MTNIQIRSVSAPFDEPELLRSVARLLMRVDAMGLLPDRVIRDLNASALRRVFRHLAETNLAATQSIQALGSLSEDPVRLREIVEQTLSVLEETPVPSTEWKSVSELLGDELLTEVLDVSLSSIRRYRSGERPTPAEVADRLHFLALLVADLRGGYNELGIRNWFGRRRKLLEERSPVDVLSGPWHPDDPAPARLRVLAESLTASPAT